MKAITKLSNKEKELNKKRSEVFLYEYGQEYTDKICVEIDALHEKYRDLEIPDSLDNWFHDFSKEQEKKERKAKFRKKGLRVFRRVAVFVVAFILVSGALTLGVEAFRLRVFNLFVEEKEQYTDLSILEQDNPMTNIIKLEVWYKYYYPEYLSEIS